MLSICVTRYLLRVVTTSIALMFIAMSVYRVNCCYAAELALHGGQRSLMAEPLPTWGCL